MRLKTYVTIGITSVAIVGLLNGCAVSNEKLFENVRTTNDTTLGYTIKNPIRFKNGDLGKSTDALYYYLNHLITADNRRLKLIRQYAVKNPDYKKPSILIENRFTGLPNGWRDEFLDLMELTTEITSDTIRLYFNINEKDTVRVPVGLKLIQ